MPDISALSLIAVLYFRMGKTISFQPLTKEDKITVVLYRTGIFISALCILMAAVLSFNNTSVLFVLSGLGLNLLFLTLYLGTGLSVFFIHLYVGKFHRILKKIYYLAIICLALLFLLGKGNPVLPLFRTPAYTAMLLMPISLCLGFITAKEAFCFKLFEGYILALIMPACIFFYSAGLMDRNSIPSILTFIAAMLVFFTLRKIFMPVHYDIGDKSAYQP